MTTSLCGINQKWVYQEFTTYNKQSDTTTVVTLRDPSIPEAKLNMRPLMSALGGGDHQFMKELTSGI